MFSAALASIRYRSSGPRDCSLDLYAQRCETCEACPLRRLNACAIDNLLISVKARRVASTCPARKWPGEEPHQDPSSSPSTDNRQPTTAAQPQKPRVGIVYPMWQAMGGVEEITRTIIGHCDQVDWSGLCALGDHFVDRESLARLNQALPAGGPEILPHVLSNSDALIVWGFRDRQPWLERWKNSPPYDVGAGGGRKVIAVAHGTGKFTADQLAITVPLADAFVAVSELAATAFPETHRERVQIIHNGIRWDRLTPTSSRCLIEKEVGLRPSGVNVGYVGRLSEEKNPLAAAHAVALLGNNHTAVYIGDGPKGSDIIAEAERIAPGQIKWLKPGTFPIGDLYQVLDVMVMASPAEGGPLVVLEALAAGIPVVATPVGMLPELESRHGPLTYPVRINPTPMELATACLDATMSGPTGREFRDFARGVIFHHYSAARCGDKWGNLLTGLFR